MTGGLRRIVVFALLWEPGLGDLVQRNTLLYLLRRAHPAAEITLVVGRRTADRFGDLLTHHCHASRVITGPDFDGAGRGSVAALHGRLAAERFELAVIDPDSLGLLAEDAARCGIPARMGFASGAADDRFLTVPIRLPRPLFGAPDLVDLARGLAAALGLPALRPADVVAPFPHRARPAPLPAGNAGPVVAVHPGGAPHWNRRWPAGRYAELCARLAVADGASILLLGDAEEAGELAALRTAVADAAPGCAVSVHAGGSLDELASALLAADVLVGNDSAPAHVAAALDRPSVVLYGPTATEYFVARAYRRQTGINHRLPCQRIRDLVRGADIDTMPCESGCTYRYRDAGTPSPRCLTAITVDEVGRAVRAALGAAAAPEHAR
jgi:ADP-heptose:LPS heptosyltransferase